MSNFISFSSYEHEAPPKDEIRTITPSEHDGGYSLNYEARQVRKNRNISTMMQMFNYVFFLGRTRLS